MEITKKHADASSPAGQWRTTLEGYRAFYPAPLPPEISWTPVLSKELADASYVLGQLAGAGRHLPNPHLLIRPFVRREAVYSSRIEGTQATLGELLAAEAGAVVERSPDDIREVANYVVALEYGLNRLADLPLSLRLVRELHERLMSGVRGNTATPGEFRRSQNWIGRPGCGLSAAAYVPPPPDALPDVLSQWENFMNEQDASPLVHAALSHYQFEAIHPFLDGNGRVGRLLIVLLLCARGVLPAPLLYLSAYFEETRDEYYSRLRAVSEAGDWPGWLSYFFRGVERQAQDALRRALKIGNLIREWRETCAASPVALRVTDRLAANPFVKTVELSEQMQVSYNTLSRAVAFLEQKGIVRRLGTNQRNRVFCAADLLEILEENVSAA
jgi:Fic family protein